MTGLERAGRPLVVVGDSLLDIDTVGTATRLSPDGPVPVVEDCQDHARPGGAALTAWLASLDERPVRLVTPIADDAEGRRLRDLLPAHVELIPLRWSGRTPVKNRLRAGGQTVARLDRGGTPGHMAAPPLSAFAAAAAVVVADYGYGTATALRPVLSEVVGRLPVVWDPHPRGPRPVSRTRLVVPNEFEALGVRNAELAELGERARVLRAEWSVGDVAVTAGARGAVTTVGADTVQVVAADPVSHAADACGAGDRFAVAAAGALADGARPSEAVAIAVRAAGRFVAAGGLVALPGLHMSGTAPAARRRTRVATGGCFDLLHAGHISTLEAARRLGDELIVCVNSDASIRRLKGPRRPLQPAADRVRVLSALSCVDRVEVFEEDTPEQVLRRLRPDVWVKGGDYAGAELPESAVLAEWGARVVTVPFLAGRSTTGLVGLAQRRAAI